jgi:hypothetical protein
LHTVVARSYIQQLKSGLQHTLTEDKGRRHTLQQVLGPLEACCELTVVRAAIEDWLCTAASQGSHQQSLQALLTPVIALLLLLQIRTILMPAGINSREHTTPTLYNTLLNADHVQGCFPDSYAASLIHQGLTAPGFRDTLYSAGRETPAEHFSHL